MSISYKPFDAAVPWTAPKRATPGSAGYDLYASAIPNDGGLMVFSAGEQRCISTNLIIFIPEGHYGRIAPRSGVSSRGFTIEAGVIDRDYRGVVKVMIRNTLFGNTQLILNTLDLNKAIAQLIITPCMMGEASLIDSMSEVEEMKTERGEGGFGSTDNSDIKEIGEAERKYARVEDEMTQEQYEELLSSDEDVVCLV